jgi:hypothetical protein
VEARPVSESIIVRYDPRAVTPSTILNTLGRSAERAAEHGGNRPPRPSPSPGVAEEFAPVALSTAAVALAMAEAGPTVLLGLIALSALPIARRAATGVRERHIRLPQVDVATLIYLIASGRYLAAGLTTWIINAGHLASGRVTERLKERIAADPLPPRPTAASPRPGTWSSEQVRDWLFRARLDDTKAQQWAKELDRTSALPLFALAGATYLFSGGIGQALAALKMTDLGAGIRTSAPVAVLKVLSDAARESILINGGAALETLARIDTVIVGPGALQPGRGPRSREAIEALRNAGIAQVYVPGETGGMALAVADGAGRGGAEESDAETVCGRLRAVGRWVALVEADAPAHSAADLRVVLRSGSEALDPNADVILLDGELMRLPRALALARRAARTLEQNTGLVLVPNSLGLILSAMGALHSPASTVINTLATLAAEANAFLGFRVQASGMVES